MWHRAFFFHVSAPVSALHWSGPHMADRDAALPAVCYFSFSQWSWKKNSFSSAFCWSWYSFLFHTNPSQENMKSNNFSSAFQGLFSFFTKWENYKRKKVVMIKERKLYVVSKIALHFFSLKFHFSFIQTFTFSVQKLHANEILRSFLWSLLYVREQNSAAVPFITSRKNANKFGLTSRWPRK